MRVYLPTPKSSPENHRTWHSQIHFPKSQLQPGLLSCLQPSFHPLLTSNQILIPAKRSIQVLALSWALNTINTQTSHALRECTASWSQHTYRESESMMEHTECWCWWTRGVQLPRGRGLAGRGGGREVREAFSEEVMSVLSWDELSSKSHILLCPCPLTILSVYLPSPRPPLCYIISLSDRGQLSPTSLEGPRKSKPTVVVSISSGHLSHTPPTVLRLPCLVV